jgi:hypothetical protein
MPASLSAVVLLVVASLAAAQTPPRPIALAAAAPSAATIQEPSSIIPVRFQQRGGSAGRTYVPPTTGDDTRLEYQIQLEPPGLERLATTLESDLDLQERIRQETLKRDPNERVVFPEEPILSRDRYYGRNGIWPQRGIIVEPTYVCYRKLFFEDKNAERYGWELGMMQPFVSAGLFFADVALLPMHCATDPCNKNECSAGYCLPGDPVPFRLYPLEITATGLLGELAVIMALVVIFP